MRDTEDLDDGARLLLAVNESLVQSTHTNAWKKIKDKLSINGADEWQTYNYSIREKNQIPQRHSEKIKRTFLKEWIEVKQFGVHLRQITFVSLTKAIKSLFEREKSIMKPVLNSSNAYFAKLSKYLRCVKTFNVGNFFISVRSKTIRHGSLGSTDSPRSYSTYFVRRGLGTRHRYI